MSKTLVLPEQIPVDAPASSSITQKIKYSCGCEAVGPAPMPTDCPTHGQAAPTTASKTISVAVILDESGSMASCSNQTINGYNEYLNGLKKDGGHYKITLSKFDAAPGEPTCRVVYSDTPVDQAPDLTKDTYTPRGSTPLYDAIGITVNSIKDEGSILVIILTDGEENASHEFDCEKIKSLINSKESSGRWTFVYLGANQDAWAVGQTFGMRRGNTMSYAPHNTGQVFANMARGTQARMRSFAATGQSMTRSFYEDANIADVNLNPSAVDLGKLGGAKTASQLTGEEKKKRATDAANARWKNKK